MVAKSARWREKQCIFCEKTHRNYGKYCSNSCRNRGRKGKYSEETREKMSQSIRQARFKNHNENILYALDCNMKRQKNINHQPEDDLLIGWSSMDSPRDMEYDRFGDDIWQ